MRKLLILALGLVALIVAIPGKALAASPVSISLVANNANPFGPEVVGEVLGSKLVEKNQEVPTDLVDTIVLSSADETKDDQTVTTKGDSTTTPCFAFLEIGAGVLRL